MKHLSLHPLRTCSAGTTTYRATFKHHLTASWQILDFNYDFNTADKMNCLLVNALLATGQEEYDFDFDHQEQEKYDAKPTYKKFLGYSQAVINDMIVGIENRDQHKRSSTKSWKESSSDWRLRKYIFLVPMDCSSCSGEIVDMVGLMPFLYSHQQDALYDSMFALTGWKTVEINGIEFELNSIAC